MSAAPEVVGILGMGVFGALLADALGRLRAEGKLVLSARGAQSAAVAARHGLLRLENQDLVDRCGVVFLCVRAEDAPAAVQELRWHSDQLVVSTCASLSLGALAPGCRPATVVRALPMPPAPGVAGLSLLWPSEPRAQVVLESIGPVLPLPDEERFAAGCAVACMQAWAHALAGWTVCWAGAKDLDPLAAQRVAGLALQHAGARLHAAENLVTQRLLDDLATPGGLSQAGLATLDGQGTPSTWRAALDAAAGRAAERAF